MGLVHPVKTLVNLPQCLLRNPNPRVSDPDRKKLMVRVQQYLHLALLLIVFNRIFDQISQNETHLHFVHFRHDFPLANQGDLHIALLGDGTQPF